MPRDFFLFQDGFQEDRQREICFHLENNRVLDALSKAIMCIYIYNQDPDPRKTSDPTGSGYETLYIIYKYLMCIIVMNDKNDILPLLFQPMYMYIYQIIL